MFVCVCARVYVFMLMFTDTPSACCCGCLCKWCCLWCWLLLVLLRGSTGNNGFAEDVVGVMLRLWHMLSSGEGLVCCVCVHVGMEEIL